MMNPYDEQLLIDEVIYLHSLWRQGPPSSQSRNPQIPTQSPNPLPIPPPPPSSYNYHTNIASVSEPLGPHFHGSPWHLHRLHQQRTINPIPTHQFPPSHTTTSSSTFNKKMGKNRKKNKRRDPAAADDVAKPDAPPSQGVEWPCPVWPASPAAAAGWPAPKKPRLAAAPEASPQEKERLVALQSQNKACRAFREFLLGDDESDADDDGDGEEEEEVGDEWEEFEGFFMRIFTEDDSLRSYYQKFFENGEFCCLVCGAVGKKNSGKKFKDCAGLVQHSMSVLRTMKKRAHRAFGQAVCKVVGWDVDRLPVIVMKGEPLGCSVTIKPFEAEGEAKENADDGKGGSRKSDGKSEPLENNDELIKEPEQGFDWSIGECSTKEVDPQNKAENVDERTLDIGLENGGGVLYEGEPKEKVDADGKGSPYKQDYKGVSLENSDEKEHARGVDQSISEFSSKECVSNKNANFDEKMLDTGLENEGGRAIDKVSLEPMVSGAEWACKNPNSDSSSTALVWPTFHSKSSPSCSLSAKEQADMAVLQMQHKALKACQDYLVGNAGSDCDDDDENEDEDDLTDNSDPEEREEFKFFLKLFTEDSDLRRYYENNYREGDFYCLVCGGVGKKTWKRYKDCVALLQHSTAIKRTKRKQAHRAYSQVICKVLGWDIDRLPAIILKGESLGSSLAGSAKLSGEPDQTCG